MASPMKVAGKPVPLAIVLPVCMSTDAKRNLLYEAPSTYLLNPLRLTRPTDNIFKVFVELNRRLRPMVPWLIILARLIPL